VRQPRAADDFAAIRAQMEELRREREEAQAAERGLQRDPPALKHVVQGPSTPSSAQGPRSQHLVIISAKHGYETA
jgi:hypothetical protein